MKKKVAAALITMSMVMGLTTVPAMASEGTLKFCCLEYSESLDPANNVNSAWCNSRYGIGEALFRFDDTMTAQPQICDTYEVNDEHTEWVFHIRDGVTFSNGTEVTASAVVESFNYVLENNDQAVSYMSAESITADDEAGTVTIVTTEPYSDLTGILAYPYFVVLDIAESADLTTAPIATGPYVVQEYVPTQYMILTANENYWNGEVPYSELQIMFMTDSTTKYNALINGDVDLVENITTSTDLEALEADTDNYYVSVASGVRIGYCHVNVEGVLGNDTLRKAVMMALDDDTMCDVTTGGMYTAGFSVLPSCLDYGYDELTDATPYDVDAAIALLDEAGIVDTDGDGYRELDGEKISLNYVTYESRNLQDFCAAIQTQLAAIGIEVVPNITDYDTGLALAAAGEFDLNGVNELAVPCGDPQSFLNIWYSSSEKNYGNYSNEEYDALYEELINTFDTDARKEIIQEMQQILIDDAAVLVHGYYNSSMASSTSITGAEIATADYYWITTDIQPAE
ncbi:MAG: ABC transporter substrate-binding protein [Clostridiales bacterium]|nr:ABC transporter substrate-binding protein [Clostridiales bacterium]